MLREYQGILLHHFRYAENSLVLKVYTPEAGLQSFFVRRPGQKSKNSGLFQPLSLLEIVAWKEEKNDLAQVRELRPAYVYRQVGLDHFRNTVILFLGEVLYKSLREPLPYPALYAYLHDWLLTFDQGDFDPDAHLVCMAHLASLLGFLPDDNYSLETPFFDMTEGSFCALRPAHVSILEPPVSEWFGKMFHEPHFRSPDRRIRRALLHALTHYFALHITQFGKLKSLAVLETIIE